VGYFDEEFLSEDINESYIHERKIESIKKNNDKFKEFS
jgi:hypothetical protein